jgi:hypothetical protein
MSTYFEENKPMYLVTYHMKGQNHSFIETAH